MANDIRQLFESRHVKELLGIDKDKLHHWVQNKRLLKPAVEGKGRGGRNKFSFENLLELALIQELLPFGIELNGIAGIMKGIREWDEINEKSISLWEAIISKRQYYKKRGAFLLIWHYPYALYGFDFYLVEKKELMKTIVDTKSQIIINLLQIIYDVEYRIEK